MKTTNHPSEIKLDRETFIQLQELIESWLFNRDYKVSGNVKYLSNQFESESLGLHHSMNKKKQFKKRIFKFSKKQTIKQLQNLLNEFKIDSFKVDLSDKERQIVNKRIEMKQLKERYEKTLAEYKLEKGNYYKNKQ